MNVENVTIYFLYDGLSATRRTCARRNFWLSSIAVQPCRHFQIHSLFSEEWDKHQVLYLHVNTNRLEQPDCCLILQQLATRLSLNTNQLHREWETQKVSSYHNHRSAMHHLALV